jgi:hypothetical protein
MPLLMGHSLTTDNRLLVTFGFSMRITMRPHAHESGTPFDHPNFVEDPRPPSGTVIGTARRLDTLQGTRSIPRTRV